MRPGIAQSPMKSTNFEFLRPRWPELASLAGFAESYSHGDPVAAVVKLRVFGELIVQFIYDSLRLPRPLKPNLNDLLHADAFQAAAPRVIVSKLHALRIHGNHAAHGEQITQKTSLWLLKEAFDLGRWVYLTFSGGALADCPDYKEPPPGGVESQSKKELQRERKAVLEQLAGQEAQMQQLLADLEATRERAQLAETSLAELRTAQEATLTAGTIAANALDFDEQKTRRLLIDSLLAEAGWQIGAESGDTEEVSVEVEVPHQPTASGIGYADYVLYDLESGKPLAVVEAKKTSIDPEVGRTQAKCYADGLEKLYGYRPTIFYTNGYDLWIWDDAQQEPPRKIYGFHSKESLQYRHFQREAKEPLSSIGPNPAIAGRMYQIEAVRRVIERFAEKKRKALIVQATGTGKTRVAVSLCDALVRARWAHRILFLCDRRELRKQAYNVFKDYLPGEPRTIVTAETARDRDKRIYLATYPAMMKCFETFDVGFFDLIIADESHRSIYNRYRDIFQYFDALQVGLTATPVDHIARSTYRIFDCEQDDPTVHYSYEDAIRHNPPYLVPFVVETNTTPFLREGIKYSQMTRQQRDQLDEEDPEPASIDFDRDAVDKRVFNKDTNRHILRNLMERGIRDATGTHVGKSIVFARNHNHAILLQTLFDEMYPQYGGAFCRVIDNYDPRAEDLIDDFKDPKSDLTIAISVDMLDTGVDVPEVVNLVFAKPIYSFVKFWQMIGRGTRLCLNLFGLGRHKTHFMIFDHWKNFEWFDQTYKPAEPPLTKSLLQQVFDARVRLAEASLVAQERSAFDLAISLIAKDLASLPEKSIAVREKWKEIMSLSRPEVLRQFEAATKAALLHDVAPLMQWVNITGHEEAYQLDRLICQLQIEKLKASGKFDDLKDDLLARVGELRINLSQVAIKVPVINRVKTAQFWSNCTVEDLENIRQELRGIIKYRLAQAGPGLPPKVIDVREDASLVERDSHKVRLDGLDLVAYRNRVLKVLTDLFQTNVTLQKIKSGEPVNGQDLEDLCSLVLTQEPGLDLRDLTDYYPESAGHLDQAIRGIIGLDAQAVHERFTRFVHQHPRLAAHQIKFLDLLQNYISQYGSIEVERLYEPPFTILDSDGLDGVFPEESLAQELLLVIDSFRPQPGQEGPAQ